MQRKFNFILHFYDVRASKRYIQMCSGKTYCRQPPCTHRMGVDEITEAAALPHQLAIDDHREVDVEDDVVVDGESEHDADQRELRVVLEAARVEPKHVRLVVQNKHACKHTKQNSTRQCGKNQHLVSVTQIISVVGGILIMFVHTTLRHE